MNPILILALVFAWLVTLLLALAGGVIFGLYAMTGYVRHVLARNGYALVNDRLVRIMEGGNGRG